MNIYKEYIPYTYFIGWSKHNKFYYGRRTAKGCHPDEFWVKYFTSSNEVKQFRKEHGEPDIIQIRKTFPNNPDACKLWESKFLEKVDAQHNESFLNKMNGDHKWDVTGKLPVKDKEGNTFSVSTDDPRYLSGELQSVNKNKILTKDKEGNIFSVLINDPRYQSGELIPVATGCTVVKDEYGNKFLVSVDDPRFLSGELSGVTKGIPTNRETISVKDVDGNTCRVSTNDPRYLSGELQHTSTGIKHKIITCPYCNKSGGIANMKRYHFDNCKFK